ncbi:MAG: sulfur oxidation c-type cytochrome SoxA [Rhodospirillales bacterium]|nr:sulfur oxidation c-type cytochrome SoxA [Rhodospirillales bacterium]
MSACRPLRLLLGSLVVLAVAAAGRQAAPADDPIAPADKRSGRAFQSKATQAMQDDDFANPGMLWVEKGAALWRSAPAAGAKACAGCHEEAAMKGVAARHPAFDAKAGRPINIEQRVNRCRVDRQGAAALAYESEELLALTAFVAHQSRGVPVEALVDGPARPFFEAGRALHETRMGQLNLACAHCHDRNWGRHLGPEIMSQGHPTGYPAYRLEWQGVGSLHRRLRSCNIGVRAEPFEAGSPEYVNLELYLAWRARGLPIETPGVRR